MLDRDTKEILIGASALLIFALYLTFLNPLVSHWFQN
jgi:hypothetical protein